MFHINVLKQCHIQSGLQLDQGNFSFMGLHNCSLKGMTSPFCCVLAIYEGVPRYSMSSDDDVFKHLATAYSFNHGSMYKGIPCRGDREGFRSGISNGAKWYPVHGKFSKLIMYKINKLLFIWFSTYFCIHSSM